MRFTLPLYVTLIFLLALAACRNERRDGFEEMKWESVDPLADSLTMALERQFYDASPAVKIERIIGILDSAAAEEKGTQEKATRRLQDRRMARSAFWKARLAKREGNPELTERCLARAFSLTDSVRDSYTFHRLLSLGDGAGNAEQDSAPSPMSRLMENLDYYCGIGDRAMEASTSIQIANALGDSYQPDLALEYFQRADSLHSLLGLDKYVSRNRINLCSVFYKSGNRQKGDSLMDILLKDPFVKEDSMAYNTVLRNCYIFRKDFGRLREGALQMEKLDSSSPNNAVYDLLLGRHYASEGNGEMAAFHIRRAYGRLDAIRDLALRSEILREAARQAGREGLKDSAYNLQNRYVEEFERYSIRKQPREIAHLHNHQILARYEMEKAATRSYYLVRILILVLILLFVGSGGAFMLIKARQRHRLQEQRIMLDKMESQLQIEGYRRQYMAMNIGMEETDRHLEEIMRQIELLNKEGKVSHTEMTRIKQVIQQHTSNRDDWKQYNELFVKAHPMFEKNLNERYPGLSEGQRKLAIYIYTGMSNKQIATFLNVRPESIKQARWRLRQKMGLSAEESLEEALRRLT